MHDSLVLSATEVVLPDNNLNTLEKLIVWSQCFFLFCRRYLVFSLVPSLAAFCCSAISFMLFDNFCIPLIQVLWVNVVICPILGITFVVTGKGSVDTIE
jgi:magnesium-transporting ATPase (P-type)